MMSDVYYINANRHIDESELVRFNSLYMANEACVILPPGHATHLAAKDGQTLTCVKHRKAWKDTYEYWLGEYGRVSVEL